MVYTEKQWKKFRHGALIQNKIMLLFVPPISNCIDTSIPWKNISQFWCAYMDADMQISSIEELCGTIPEVDDSSEHRRSVHRI
jgi:hypothetical protein